MPACRFSLLLCLLFPLFGQAGAAPSLLQEPPTAIQLQEGTHRLELYQADAPASAGEVRQARELASQASLPRENPLLQAFLYPQPTVQQQRSPYFLQYRLQNLTAATRQWILHLDGYSSLEACLIRDDGTVELKSITPSTPLSARDILDRSPAAALYLAPGESLTLLIRSTDTNASFLLWQAKHYYASQRTSHMLHAAYFSFFLIICFYNLFLYRTLKDKSYLYYALYISFFAIIQFTVTGYGFRYLWPEAPEYSQRVEGFFLCLALLFGMQTIHSFLKVEKQLPAASKLIQLLSLLAVLFIPLGFFFHRWWEWPLSLLVLVSAVAMLAIGILVLIRGYRPARYYLIGWCFLLTAIVLFYLSVFGLLPENFITNHGVKVAAVCDMIFISLGLNDRLRQENRQKRKTRNKILTSWREHARAQEAATKALSQQHEALKNAYQDLAQSQQVSLLLKQQDQLKSAFFANISHEFRTPLTLIMGAMQKLLRERPQDAPLRQTGQTIVQNSQTLQQLINHLLDLSRLDSGRLALKPRRMELSAFLRSRLESFGSLADARNISYTYSLPEGQQHCDADPEQLEKIVNNLLSNAFKFTASGGRITVAAALRPGTNGHVLSLQVSDSGIGIPKNQQGAIFDRFYQVDHAASRSYEGSGIGLALVKELVALHGGTIGVESEPGQGASFRLHLPLPVYTNTEAPADPHLLLQQSESSPLPLAPCPDSTPLQEAEAPQEAPHRPKKEFSLDLKAKQRVLVVEDKPELRAFICDSLSPLFKTYEAADGLEGFALATRLMPDLVISDVMMPLHNGIAFCQSLKADSRTSHIPVILLTARADQDSRLEGLASGADDYLTKPFDPTELLLRAKNLIEQRQKLRHHFSQGFGPLAAAGEADCLDAKFQKKIFSILEEHLDDADFSVEKLSQEVALSKSQLYRKLQALTGLSPNALLQQYRIRRAAELLEKNMATVSEAAYAVGFTNLSYFAKCFREHYGHAPSSHGRLNSKAEDQALGVSE